MSNVDFLNKILHKEDDDQMLSLAHLSREFSCVNLLTGVDFEIYDANGCLLYRVRQKPISFDQLNCLLKMLHDLNVSESKQMKKSSKRRK